uniref:19 kDa cysteine-rich protein n=1 Tax=Soil-borne wheat mosaic virus TaxID=28375 RepID=A0A191TB82_SBWMV|nr:19 kDa cysteine-rich protein [Soil-borne wheat mosaic virus]
MSTVGFHTCASCVDGPKSIKCVSKYRISVYKTLGLDVVKCRLPADCGVNCGMPAAFILEQGHPKLTMDGYCGEKHRGYVLSGAWRHAQLRSLNSELDALEAREESLRAQIKALSVGDHCPAVLAYVPKKLTKLKAEVHDVTGKKQTCITGLVDVMDSALVRLAPDSPPKKISSL